MSEEHSGGTFVLKTHLIWICECGNLTTEKTEKHAGMPVM